MQEASVASVIAQSRGRRAQRVAYEQTVAPAFEALTLAEAKAHLKVQHAFEDAQIAQACVAARGYVESGWGLALIEQTWKATLDLWPRSGLLLRPHRVRALVSARVWGAGAYQSFDLANLILAGERPAYVHVTDGGTVPLPDRSIAGIELTFTTGLADAPADDVTPTAVPDDIKRAMLMLVGHWYRNREATLTIAGRGMTSDVSLGVADLMRPYRSKRLA